MRVACVALVIVAASCGGDGDDGGPPFRCVARPDDTSGYLQPICQYIVDELGEYEIDPNTLEIESITPNDETDQVRLSCCFTGDIATMDRATKTVLGFSLGDI
jgi:hypothetical protein